MYNQSASRTWLHVSQNMEPEHNSCAVKFLCCKKKAQATTRETTNIQQNRLSQHCLDIQHACEVLPLSIFDLAVCHWGAIQGQRPLLQHSHSGTLLRQRLFCRSRQKGQSGQVRYMRLQGDNINNTIQGTGMWVFVFPTREKTFPSHRWDHGMCHLCQCVSSVLLWSDILRVYWPSALSPQQRTVEKVQSW